MAAQRRGRKRKRRVVLFLGAGASRACGYPVTGDILPEILRRLWKNEFDDEFIKARASLFKATLRKLLPANGEGRIPQITEVLSVIDFCLDSGEELFAAGKGVLRLSDTRWLLERAISRVIRKIHKRDTVPRDIAAWIDARRSQGADVTIVSTNYDFSLDRVLFDDLDDWNADYLKMDFGFTWRDPDNGQLVHPATEPLFRLYKLHGSLNWLGCGRCGNIYVNFARTVVDLADGDDDWSTCHCGFRPLRAVLIAPSFVRRYRDHNLLSIWRSAAEALRLADEVVFAGYSLPAEDVGIRALLMRSIFPRQKAPAISVVSGTDDALPRYRQLFPECRYTSGKLRGFLDDTCTWQRPPRIAESRWLKDMAVPGV